MLAWSAPCCIYIKYIDDEDQNNKQINEDEAQNNEQENKIEEENKRKELYDGIMGYWGAEPTPNSEIGRKYQEFAQERIRKNSLNVEDRKKKDEIWKQFSTDTKVKKDTFDKKVLATLSHKLEEERYNICKDRLSGLINCRENSDCYHKRGLSPTIFTNPNFGTQYETILYEDIAGFAAQQGIILTTEELKAIAENNSRTRGFCKGLQDGVKELSIKRDEILNPKKQD